MMSRLSPVHMVRLAQLGAVIVRNIGKLLIEAAPSWTRLCARSASACYMATTRISRLKTGRQDRRLLHAVRITQIRCVAQAFGDSLHPHRPARRLSDSINCRLQNQLGPEHRSPNPSSGDLGSSSGMVRSSSSRPIAFPCFEICRHLGLCRHLKKLRLQAGESGCKPWAVTRRACDSGGRYC